MQGKSLFPKLILSLGLALFFVLLFLAANKAGDILSDRQQIKSVIEAGKLTQAQVQIDKLKAKHSRDSDVADALYGKADTYGFQQKWEQANNLYRQIIQDYPDSSSASRANLGIARVKVLSLLAAKDYDGAEEALDELVTDFTGHPDLPETLYWVGRRYGWSNKYEEEKDLYQQIIQNPSDSPYVNKARLGFSRAGVISLIASRDYDGAEESLDRLIADFSEHPDLPDTLYWIAGSYRWTDKYEMAKSLYGRIIQEYPESSVADKAKQQFQVMVEGMDVFALIESGREKEAQDAINQLMVESAGNEGGEISPYTVFLCGDRYYAKGLQEEELGLEDEASANFIKAIDVWQDMIGQLPASTSVAHAYYHSANCYSKMGDHEHAVEQYVKLLQDYPDYYLAWDVQFRIGQCYQMLKDENAIARSSADARTKAAYEAVLEKYADCPAAEIAEKWVKKHTK